MKVKTYLLASLTILLCVLSLYGKAHGKLQIHFMDVGQGPGSLLILPGGQDGREGLHSSQRSEVLHVDDD